MGASGMPLAWGLPANPKASRWYMYSSNHTGGVVNFSFGDGSVKFIRFNVDPVVWMYAIVADDGNVFDHGQL